MSDRRGWLTGLALLAALATAPCAASTQASADGALTRPMPPAVMAKLLHHVELGGRPGVLPASLAPVLGLAPSGQTWAFKQFAVRTPDTGVIHALAVGVAAPSDLVFSARGDVAITVFRVRRDGALVSAVNFFPQTQTSVALPAAEAAGAFANERGFWIRTADDLIGEE